MDTRTIRERIISQLKKNDIIVNKVKINGFDKESKNINTVIVSLNDISSGYNILYSVKQTLDEVELTCGICFLQRLVEF